MPREVCEKCVLLCALVGGLQDRCQDLKLNSVCVGRTLECSWWGRVNQLRESFPSLLGQWMHHKHTQTQKQERHLQSGWKNVLKSDSKHGLFPCSFFMGSLCCPAKVTHSSTCYTKLHLYDQRLFKAGAELKPHMPRERHTLTHTHIPAACPCGIKCAVGCLFSIPLTKWAH